MEMESIVVHSIKYRLRYVCEIKKEMFVHITIQSERKEDCLNKNSIIFIYLMVNMNLE